MEVSPLQFMPHLVIWLHSLTSLSEVPAWVGYSTHTFRLNRCHFGSRAPFPFLPSSVVKTIPVFNSHVLYSIFDIAHESLFDFAHAHCISAAWILRSMHICMCVCMYAVYVRMLQVINCLASQRSRGAVQSEVTREILWSLKMISDEPAFKQAMGDVMGRIRQL